MGSPAVGGLVLLRVVGFRLGGSFVGFDESMKSSLKELSKGKYESQSKVKYARTRSLVLKESPLSCLSSPPLISLVSKRPISAFLFRLCDSYSLKCAYSPFLPKEVGRGTREKEKAYQFD